MKIRCSCGELLFDGRRVNFHYVRLEGDRISIRCDACGRWLLLSSKASFEFIRAFEKTRRR